MLLSLGIRYICQSSSTLRYIMNSWLIITTLQVQEEEYYFELFYIIYMLINCNGIEATPTLKPKRRTAVCALNKICTNCSINRIYQCLLLVHIYKDGKGHSFVLNCSFMNYSRTVL